MKSNSTQLKQQIKIARQLKRDYGRVSELMLMRKFQISSNQAMLIIKRLTRNLADKTLREYKNER